MVVVIYVKISSILCVQFKGCPHTKLLIVFGLAMNLSVVGSNKHIFKVDKCLQAIVHFEIIYAERAPHIIQGQIDQVVTIFRHIGNNLVAVVNDSGGTLCRNI